MDVVLGHAPKLARLNRITPYRPVAKEITFRHGIGHAPNLARVTHPVVLLPNPLHAILV